MNTIESARAEEYTCNKVCICDIDYVLKKPNLQPTTSASSTSQEPPPPLVSKPTTGFCGEVF